MTIHMSMMGMFATMVVVILGFRLAMLPGFQQPKLPKLVVLGLKFIPIVLLATLLGVAVLMPGQNIIQLDLYNPYIIGAITACFVAGITHHLMVSTMVSGIVFFMSHWAFAVL